jgi:transposase
MKAYSLDLRQKVLAAVLRGDRTIREVAETFGVGTTFVDKVLALYRAGSDLAPRPHGGGYPARLLPRHEKLLRAQARRSKDSTLEELRAHLAAEAGLVVSASTVSRALTRLDLPRKKGLAASERNNYKRGWFRRRARRVNHRRLIFVDETAVNTAMTRRHGRAPRGERVHDSAPRNYGAHTSVIGAMGLRGLVAMLSVEGAVDTLCFDAYAERVLGPRLRRGDVVVLDNLTAHRASRIEAVAEARGAQVLWLSPYSPDFSPIEQCWSKIKAYLRGAKARAREHLEEALTAALGLVTRADIRGWFKHCGYSLARK